jgi:hypothetical protein
MAKILISLVFVLGYSAIAFEHYLKVSKSASALLTGVFVWLIYIFTKNQYPICPIIGKHEPNIALSPIRVFKIKITQRPSLKE